jgi:uncharacterized protein with von Willebrand factor type A (vWA) domain
MLEIEGKNKMSIWDDIKKAAKGSKEYQAGKAKRKAAKAKKKENKTWAKAVKKQKKSGSGETLSSLVSKRKGLTKGTAEYAAVQNKINKAYGVKKRHKATVASKPKKTSKPTPKPDVRKIVKNISKSNKTTKVNKPKKPIGETVETSYDGESVEKDNVITSVVSPKPINKPKKVKGDKGDIVDRFKEAGGKKAWKKALRMEDGGKVEGGGMFDWPTRDARNGGKK